MKRKTIYSLQLFADEPQTEPANDPTEQKAKSKSDGTQESNEEKAGGAQKKFYTDEDVDKLINRKFAEWQAKKDQEINEAKKLADMNAQQRAEYERDKLQKELDAYKMRETLSKMAKTARSMLAQQDIHVSDELVSALVTKDAQTTADNVQNFAKAFQTAVSQAVEQKITHKEPKTGKSKTITKDDIMAIKDTAARQKAIAENIELFQTGGN